MKLFDVNVLVYAHREDSPNHIQFKRMLVDELDSGKVIALTSFILSGFLRIVTHPKIFNPPTPLDQALAFANQLARHPHTVFLKPTDQQWTIFTRMCEQVHAKGNLIPDALIASFAIDAGCLLITTDGDYSRFHGLQWRHPLV